MTKTILLADDSLTIQKVVELTFADTQYHVVSLSSGDELLEKLEEVQPELVICDIIMPGIEGYDVCQQIKSNPATLHIPVILLSGTFEPFDRNRALAAGSSEIITKPFEAKRLIDAVEKLLSPTSVRAGDDGGDSESLGFGDASQEEGPASPVADFGTRLSASDAIEEEDQHGAEKPDDGIDFTTSGFAEMEAAAQAMDEPRLDSTSDGLDLSPEDVRGITGAGSDGEMDASEDEDFADAFSLASPSFETTEPLNGVDQSDPFGTGDEVPPPDQDGPFLDTVEPLGDDRSEEAGPEQETTMDDTDSGPDLEVKSAEEAFAMDPRPVIMTDADTAPVPGLPDEDRDAEQPIQADEQQLAEPNVVAGFALSDEDVDRIARRLIELSTDRIEQIVWEVVPDVAEVAVRERIRQLEAEFETEN